MNADGQGAVSPGVEPLFPIRVVARLTGINPVTIRAWERRYGLVTPQRTPGGHRLYSRADLDRLRSAARLIDQGLPISQASRLIDGEHTAPAWEPGRTFERFMDRARALDDDGMTALYEALRARVDDGAGATAILARLPETMARLSALQQRFVEAWLASLLGARLQAGLPEEAQARVLICVGEDAPGRAWGAVLSLLLCELGMRPLLLGPLPAAALVEAVKEADCTAVVIAGGLAPAGGPGTPPGMPPEVPCFRAPFSPAGTSGAVALDDALPRAARRVADAALLADGTGSGRAR